MPRVFRQMLSYPPSRIHWNIAWISVHAFRDEMGAQMRKQINWITSSPNHFPGWPSTCTTNWKSQKCIVPDFPFVDFDEFSGVDPKTIPGVVRHVVPPTSQLHGEMAKYLYRKTLKTWTCIISNVLVMDVYELFGIDPCPKRKTIETFCYFVQKWAAGISHNFGISRDVAWCTQHDDPTAGPATGPAISQTHGGYQQVQWRGLGQATYVWEWWLIHAAL